MRFRSFSVVATLSVAIAACSSSASPASVSTPPASAAASVSAPSASAAGGVAAAVSIKGFAFNPATIQAKVGENITWTNEDTVGHTVTVDDKSVDSGTIDGGKTYSHAFTQAGTFTYHCEIHPTMKGTVTVS